MPKDHSRSELAWAAREAAMQQRMSIAARKFSVSVGLDVSTELDHRSVHDQLMEFLMAKGVTFLENKALELGIDLTKFSRAAERAIQREDEKFGDMTPERAERVRTEHYLNPFSNRFSDELREASKSR